MAICNHCGHEVEEKHGNYLNCQKCFKVMKGPSNIQDEIHQLRDAVKNIIAINALTNGEFCGDVKGEVAKLKNLDNEELKVKSKQIANLYELVSTHQMLAEPTQEGLECIELLKRRYSDATKG